MKISDWYPIRIGWGSVSPGASVGLPHSPPAGSAYVISGIDAYGQVQPDNGEFRIDSEASGPGTFAFTIYRVQQSANFPGPFAWRGMWLIPPGSPPLIAISTIPFDFIVWGFVIPAYDSITSALN